MTSQGDIGISMSGGRSDARAASPRRPDSYTINREDFDIDVLKHILWVKERIEVYNEQCGSEEDDGTMNHYLREPVKIFCLIKSLPWREPFSLYKADYYFKYIRPWEPLPWCQGGNIEVTIDQLEMYEIREDPTGEKKNPTMDNILRDIRRLVRRDMKVGGSWFRKKKSMHRPSSSQNPISGELIILEDDEDFGTVSFPSSSVGSNFPGGY